MIRAIGISLVGAVILSCLLTPPIFDFLAASIVGMPWPFSRILNRVFLSVLLLFIFYFRRDFDLASIKRALRFPDFWRDRLLLLVLGFAISLATVSLCMASVFDAGTLRVNERTDEEIVRAISETLPVALVISVIEESFFRVFFLSRLLAYCSRLSAVVYASLLYAIVHFISPDNTFVYTGKSWLEGFTYLPHILHRLVEPGTALGITGLFVIGLLLSFALFRVGSVYISIGLHMGWIFALRMITFLSIRNPDIEVPSGLGGRYYLFSQSSTWLSFALVAFLIAMLPRYQKENRTGEGR